MTNVFGLGDVHVKFTIQSTSKPITYALTLEELGTELIHQYQGREPSGRMFNEIALDHNSKNSNPIFNNKKIGLKENFKDFHKMTGKVQSKIF